LAHRAGCLQSAFEVELRPAHLSADMQFLTASQQQK